MSERPHRPGAPRLPAWVTHELPLLACMTLIWILSDQPSLPGPGERGSLLRDIFNYGSHALIYGILAVLAWRVIALRRERLPAALAARPRLVAALFALAWGLLDEWHQSYVPGRTASPWDALTDLAGATLALWLVPRILPWWRDARQSRDARAHEQRTQCNTLTTNGKP